MTRSITIASGKGGTGKTSVSLLLFDQLKKISGQDVKLVDCDVEEPNLSLFFSDLITDTEKTVYKKVPDIITSSCTFCRKCVEYCEFNAIVIIPPYGIAEVNRDLCHSCGACFVACSENALAEFHEPVGRISIFRTAQNHNITEGRLKIGSSMQTMLIRELKKSIEKDNGIILYDAPPGTSCPVVETIEGSDYVILVAEPTPFGLHDLKLMVDLATDLEFDFGVLINKAGLGNEDIYHFLEARQIELLGEIPFMKEFARLYANGALSTRIPPNIDFAVQSVAEKILKILSL